MTRHLVKASEIRRLLNLDSDSRVYDLARRAILPGVVRIGRQVRFNIDKVLEFVDSGGQSLPGGWRIADGTESTGHATHEEQAPSPQDAVLAASENVLGGGRE